MLLLSRYALCAAFLLAAPPLHAQKTSSCAEKKIRAFESDPKTTLAAVEEEWYDVHHVALDLRMTNLSTAVSGNATTRARVTAPALPVYAFELDTTMTIDSVLVNGQKLPVATSGKNLRKVSLPAPLMQGQTLTAQVFYHGQPPSGTGLFISGLNHFSLPSGTNVTYTLADMYYAAEWWPCKMDIRDKIDSTDFHITVPAGTMAGSNGVLQNVVTVSPTETRYEWRHRYPIVYYLISAAVAPYTERSYTMQFADGDTMRVQNFIYDLAGMDTESLNALDSLGYTLNLFSEHFGKYPFYKEKYGNCIAPLGGGMEHQTMTTLGYNVGREVTMHELGHQWWGNSASQQNWRDIWLSEGFASFCELLFLENADGPAAAQAARTNKISSVISRPGGSVLVADTNDIFAVFDSRLVYDKGAMAAHMLRYIAPADSLFFKACRQYLQTYQFRNATTSDLQAVFENVYGQPLDSFFRQWIAGQGFPVYAASWNYRNGTALVELRQTTSVPASVPFFQMPVEIQFNTPAGPQRRRVMPTQPTEVFSFPMADSVTGIRVDPEEHLIKRRGVVSRNPALSVAHPDDAAGISVSPNPANDTWQVSGLPPQGNWELTDVGGKKILTGKTRSEVLLVPAQALPAGVYMLRVAGLKETVRLLRP